MLYNYIHMNRIENITVSEKDLGEVKLVIGYPVIDQEFAHVMTDEQIKDYAIAPALQEFYTYFPMVIPKEVPVSSNGLVEVACEENVIGIYKQYFTALSSTLGSNMMNQGLFLGNPFASASQINYSSANSRGYGTPYNYDFSLFSYQNRFLSESMEASNSGYYIDYNEIENTLKVKSLVSGTFYIELAAVGNDVSKVPFRLKQSFIKYAQSLLLDRFASILGMSESDLPSSIDVDALREKSTTLKEEVLLYWREASIGYAMR